MSFYDSRCDSYLLPHSKSALLLPEGKTPVLRLWHKFSEKKGIKTDRLLDLYQKYQQRVYLFMMTLFHAHASFEPDPADLEVTYACR